MKEPGRGSRFRQLHLDWEKGLDLDLDLDLGLGSERLRAKE
jgi:hypothetical protein